jgi:hypothetical protein
MQVGGLETREGPSAAGTWQGQPRSLCRTARGGTGPLPGGWGVRAPEAGRSGLACDGPATTRSGPGPPWRDRVREGPPKAPQPSWGRGGPGLVIAQGGSRDHGPSCQARAMCHVPQKVRGRLRIVRRQALDTLAGGAPIYMYRQRPNTTARTRCTLLY